MTVERHPHVEEMTGLAGLRTKRLMDIVISALGILVLLPVFAVVALAIRIEGGGPVFYRQFRVGRSGRLFRIEKFRSMRPSKGGTNLTIAGDVRVTRVGAVLRRTKIDELPQLLNVLYGDMSLVGPRPETPDLMVHYTPSQRALMESIQPGMTDYASVLLRDESALLATAPDPGAFYRERLMPLKCELCARYVREIGLRTDLRLILATVWGVFLPSSRNPFLDPVASGLLKSWLEATLDHVA
ncbi:sugar transferase [Labrys miyagiensis]|nr:sugar transferase [Labrys miyagiensis]